jgi:integrase
VPLTLKPRGKKKTLWIVGSLCGERIRESTRTADRRLAEAKLIAVTKEIEERFIYGSKHSFTFAEAVELYTRRVKPKPYHAKKVRKLLDKFGLLRCVDITPSVVLAYEEARWPEGVKNSTLISYLYGPLRSVLRYSAKHQLCPAVLLPVPEADDAEVRAAPEDHLVALLRCEMPRWLRAAILILTFHGTRPVDLGRLKWSDVSFSSNVITFGKTKNGKAHSPVMHPDVREALQILFSKDAGEGVPNLANLRDAPVFPKLQNASSAYLNYALQDLAKKNGLPFYSTHKIGRHAFAERILNAGFTLKEVQQGGNWASISVVAKKYGHLERSRVDSIVTGMRIDTNLAQISEAEEIAKREQGLKK